MLYTDTHRQLMESVRRFIAAEIAPHADAWEEAEAFPAHELFRKLGEAGFLGITKPADYGGLGLDYSYAVAANEALGEVPAGGIGMAITVQTDMATPALALSAKLHEGLRLNIKAR